MILVHLVVNKGPPSLRKPRVRRVELLDSVELHFLHPVVIGLRRGRRPLKILCELDTGVGKCEIDLLSLVFLVVCVLDLHKAVAQLRTVHSLESLNATLLVPEGLRDQTAACTYNEGVLRHRLALVNYRDDFAILGK